MFKIGDNVVYNQYICHIDKIRFNERIGTEYFVMHPVNNSSLMIEVPTENKLNKIKTIMNYDEAMKLIKSIKEIDTLNIEDKYIEQQYKELMNTGDKKDLIKIIKTTYLRNNMRINNNKKISEKDDTYFKKAETLLYNELMYSLNMTYDEVKKFIIESCSE